jgi:Tol biopolymer transport system component
MGRRAIRVIIGSVLFLAGGRTAPGAPPRRGAPGEPAGDRPAGIIAFSSLAPRGWDLYLFEVASRRPRRLTDHPALDFNAAFAPDGRSLAFISTCGGNHELYATAIDGARPRRLTEEFAVDDHPAWSPDGTQVVFSNTRRPSDRPGLAWNALYVLRIHRARGGFASGPAVDSEVRQLSPAGVAAYSPAWSPPRGT